MSRIMPSNQPKISVIMASNNNETTIEAAINGVIKQSHGNFELILIDDGSIDQTKVIMEKFAKECSKIRLIYNPLNIGKSFSVNLGVLVSNSEFFAIADADDIWLQDKLEKQIETLNRYPSLDVLGGQLIRFGDWGEAKFPTKLPLSNPDIHKQFNRGIMAINNPTAVIRKSAFLSVGGYSGILRRNEDFDLFLRMHKIGSFFVNVDDTLVRYRTKTRIQPLSYWIRNEIGRQSILISNSNPLIKAFPLLRLPFILRDIVRLWIIYNYLWFKD